MSGDSLADLLQRKAALAQELTKEKSSIAANDLALIYHQLGDYSNARKMFELSLEIGLEPNAKAIVEGNLGLLYQDDGNFGAAEPLLRKTLQQATQDNGLTTEEHAGRCSNLAGLLADMGDVTEADRLYKQALALLKADKRESGIAYGRILHNYGLLFEKVGDYAQAENLLRQELAIIDKKHAGKTNAFTAHSWESLAFIMARASKPDEAEPLYRQAIDFYREHFGPTHPATLRVTANLGFLYAQQGWSEAADRLLQHAIDARKTALGTQHWLYADSLSDLAALRDAQGDVAAAVKLQTEVVETTRLLLDRSATVQSERQQLKMLGSFRKHLDYYLSLATRANIPAAEIYPHLFAWKGVVYARQRLLRRCQNDPAVAKRFAELRELSGQLAMLVDSQPMAGKQEAWSKTIQELSARREQLERDLIVPSRRDEPPSAFVPPGLPQMLRALPEDVLLIDFVEYEHLGPKDGKAKQTSQRRLLAFVVARAGVKASVDLGLAAPIEQAVGQWREILYRPGEREARQRSAASELRKLVWEPLTPHLGEQKTLLLSPDGPLSRAPFAALPGKKPESFLLEDFALATVPVPQAIPDILGDPQAEAPEKLKNLLLLGGIDYDADDTPTNENSPKKKEFGRKPHRGADWKNFTALDGAVGEAATIEKMYRSHFEPEKLTMLEKGAASEARFAAEAPQHRYLHLATHGFFAPAEARASSGSASSETSRAPGAGNEQRQRAMRYEAHPGLLSGLALAGANRKPAPQRDDGILTAEEVQTLNLTHVELATLSACETGLGEVAGGEGVLGLQRAFQVAGARTTVTSLWKVDDAQTRALMERFYRNLWDKDLSKLEALREAQLWMLREGGPRRDARLFPKDAPPAEDLPYSPPYYWAAFVLGGDWR